MAVVVLAGTFDTKGGEYVFVRDKILSLNAVAKVLLVDVGVQSTSDMATQADIKSSQVVTAAGRTYEDLKRLSKSDALQLMSEGLTQILLDLHAKGTLDGVMGMGGGCGSTLLAPAFQRLPMGVPKLLVSSTIACVHGRPFFSFTDMTIMYSVTDFIGNINAVNRPILSNAAVAIAAMAADYATNKEQYSIPSSITTQKKRTQPLIAATMIGATQKGVGSAMDILVKLGYQFVAFSPNGTGSQAMENVIETGVVDGVLDVTLFDLMNHVVPDNIWESSPNRLETAGRIGIPQVVSLGALDILTFGPWSKFPPEYRTRAKFENNANFATVRTSQDECTHLGELIAAKLNGSKGPVTLLIPRGGLSVLSARGGPLADAAADECLFKAIRTYIDPAVVQLIERDENINDLNFAHALADAVHAQLKHKLPAKITKD